MAQQDPNRVVATINGKSITAKQAEEMFSAIPADQRTRFNGGLPALLQQIYTVDQLADNAAKMNLDQQAPWKEQIRLARANILAQAYVAKQAGGAVTAADARQYYESHPADFDQFKLSIILIAMTPPGTPANSSGVSRTEAQALEKANDLEKKIKAGADFGALARTDSDDQSTSARGGEAGNISLANPNLPADLKTAIEKLQPNQVSEPIHVPNGYYIVKLQSRNKVPFEQVQSQIASRLQNEKNQAIVKQELEKNKIQVQDQSFFSVASTQTGAAGSGSAAPSAKPSPSLAKPQGR